MTLIINYIWLKFIWSIIGVTIVNILQKYSGLPEKTSYMTEFIPQIGLQKVHVVNKCFYLSELVSLKMKKLISTWLQWRLWKKFLDLSYFCWTTLIWKLKSTNWILLSQKLNLIPADLQKVTLMDYVSSPEIPHDDDELVIKKTETKEMQIK